MYHCYCTFVVEVTGFEPTASASRTQRSTKLSHTSLWAENRLLFYAILSAVGFHCFKVFLALNDTVFDGFDNIVDIYD